VHRVRKKLDGAGVTVRTLYGRGYVLDFIPHPPEVHPRATA
jgi:hypothetical protein